ncbi:MAG: heavy metal-associated domain-containing protein [Clostridia bacterium]
MKRSYKLNGLDCANCASKLERSIGKIEGVISVSISFMTLKMIIEVEENNFESIFNNTFALINKFEPNIEIKRC